jgi:DNA-nicking Smr family endonuclease
MSRRRQLSEEERTLWSGIARSIKPLRRVRKAAEPIVEPAISAAPAAPAPSRPIPRHDPPPAKQPPLAPFDRRLKQRVARGRASIDARIDLHGMTQSEAHAALIRFLRRSQTDGARIVLIVTGKGSGDTGLARGVLKRQVPMWLALPEFRPLVVGFEDADAGHGGQGALYVRLRRVR